MTVVSVKPGDGASVAVSRAGPRGKGWIWGEGAPTDGQGLNGEFYLDTLAYDVYGPKENGTWAGVSVASLTGQADAAEAAQAAAETAALQAESSEDAAATSAANASTSATSAAGSASDASDSASAAATSETNAATSESNAATSASSAATSETAAAGSATDAAGSAAAADTSEGNAATSASEAATSASNAASSEGAAATSETNAANSATAAAGSATDAESSADAAAQSAAEAATFDPDNFYDKTASDARFASDAQGDLADSAVQPGDLGDAAAKDVGTAAGTVAAGDHTHGHFTQTDNPHGVTKAQVGLGNADNTSDANKPVSGPQQTALNAKQDVLGFTPEDVANKGAANGYASLGGDGKVPGAQLPSMSVDTASVLSAMAGAGVDEVGTYAILVNDTGTTYDSPTEPIIAGSSLRWVSIEGGSLYSVTSPRPSGSWKMMGIVSSFRATLFLRVA